MFIRKKRVLRTIALLMCTVLLSETLLPLAVQATTSGPSAPEVFGHQPVDASDNVNLASGAFNYSVPVTSIPEYPMAYGYSAGQGMMHESSIVGFGGNLAVGSIARNVMGFPDDVKNGKVVYALQNQKQWGASGGASFGATSDDLLGAKLSELGLKAGADVSLSLGYDNYDGMFGAVSLGLGLSVPVYERGSSDGNLRLGLGLTSDSRQGAAANAGISLAYMLNNQDLSEGNQKLSRVFGQNGVGLSANAVFRRGQSTLLSASANSNLSSDYGITLSSAGNSFFGEPSKNEVSALGALANSSSFIASGSVSIPIAPPFSLGVQASYYQSKYGDETLQRNAYGFMHLGSGYDRDNEAHVSDIYLENDDAFGKEKWENKVRPVHLERDQFSVHGQGVGGAMQLHQHENGFVSRSPSQNLVEDYSLVTQKYRKAKTRPWTKASRAVSKRGVDLFDLVQSPFKKSDNSKFEELLFEERTEYDLNQDNFKFSSDRPFFRMRGDMAGEFNMASTSYQDDEPLGYDFIQWPNNDGQIGDWRFFLVGTEKLIPNYVPIDDYHTKQALSSNDIVQRSASISYKTVQDYLTQYGQLNFNDDFVNEQAFYGHFTTDFATTPNPTAVVELENYNANNTTTTNSNIKVHNIVTHIRDLAVGLTQAQIQDANDLIAEITIRKADGLQYVYGLPVFNHNSESLQMLGKDGKAPVKNGNDYTSFKKNGTAPKQRRRSHASQTFSYPYAWNLTAIIGPDYVDFDDIPGPSDGDLGYWVKFKYVKVADAYRWRVPFNGMAYAPNALHLKSDDLYSMQSGTKEIYYLAQIESAGHIAEHQYAKRFDSWSASGRYNGDAINELTGLPNDANQFPHVPYGDDFLYALTKIHLYNKHAQGENSVVQQRDQVLGKLIRTTTFQYDYSICPEFPSNRNTYGAGLGLTAADVPYHYEHTTVPGRAIKTGKLTLRKIQHFAYDHHEDPVPIPGYDLTYTFDGTTNPSINNPPFDERMVDTWGNYFSGAIDPQVQVDNEYVDFYQNYGELDKNKADQNAQAFNLKTVSLPTGGELTINYEANAYLKVENKRAFVMRNVLDAVGRKVGPLNVTDLYIDVSDLDPGESLEDVVSVGDTLYGELAFYKNTVDALKKNGSNIYLSNGFGKVFEVSPKSSPSPGKYIQKVSVFDLIQLPSEERFAFITNCKRYMYVESEEAVGVRESLPPNCEVPAIKFNKYADLEKDGPFAVVEKMYGNFANAFRTDRSLEADFNNCYGVACDELYPHQSFLRVPVHKGKYTGCRVKSIALTDEFQYASSGANNSPTAHSNVYQTDYFYDSNRDGTGESEGVATIEPGGGNASVINAYTAIGNRFFPGASIIQGKTTRSNHYAAPLKDAAANTSASREKGYTTYEFYTPADPGLQYTQHLKNDEIVAAPGNIAGKFFVYGIFLHKKIKFKFLGKKREIRVPYKFKKIKMKWDRRDRYWAQAWAYKDYTDIYGQPKAIVQYAADGVTEKGRQQMTYYGEDEAIKIYNKDFGTVKNYRPGRVDQAWAETYYTQTTGVNYLKFLKLLTANTQREFHLNSMKYTYVPPVLKQTESTVDGITTYTNFTAYDPYTGMPVEVETNDAYGNIKIARSLPAYWEFPEMGPSDENVHNDNMLTQTTANYLYLNQTNNANLLQVGVTKWSKDNWEIIPTVMCEREDLGNNEYRFAYNPTTTAQIMTEYDPNNNHLYRQVETWVYEVPLNADGTFAQYNDFDFSAGNGGADPNWKALGSSDLYDAKGNAVQSHDILGKYASSQFGYNNMKVTSNAVNASYLSFVFEGAENTYINKASGNTLLDGNRVLLKDAEIVQDDCEKAFVPATFDPVAVSNAPSATFVEICSPPGIKTTYNQPIAAINVVFNHNPSIVRTLYIYRDDDGSFRVMTNFGENFSGYVMIGTNPCTTILFDQSVFSYFQFDPTFTDHQGYQVSQPDQAPACQGQPFNYDLPNDNCIGDVHTGTYAFELNTSGGIGTQYDLHRSQLPNNLVTGTSELQRKYSAWVWMHQNGSVDGELVMQAIDASGNLIQEVSSKMSTPYASAGNWKLVRTDIDLSVVPNVETLRVFVRNQAGVVLYDDLRVGPYHAQMSCYVYDHHFGRVAAILDNDHFASWYEYDDRGRLIKVNAEIESLGKTTISQNRYNDQKQH